MSYNALDDIVLSTVVICDMRRLISQYHLQARLEFVFIMGNDWKDSSLIKCFSQNLTKTFVGLRFLWYLYYKIAVEMGYIEHLRV